MMSTSTYGILPSVSSLSAFPTPCLQPHMDNLLDNNLAGNVLWEETDLPAISPSVMDHLIHILSLNISDIEKITYTSRVSIFTGCKWELDKNAKKQTPKQKQTQDNSDLEECEDGEGSSVSVEPDISDQTSGCLEYNPQKPDGKPFPKWSEEQKWALLFTTIYTVMRMAYKKGATTKGYLMMRVYDNAIIIDDESKKSGGEAGNKASGPESAEDEQKRLMKEWVSPVYTFFGPSPCITEVGG
ncbi:uncharacterized protein EDB93DRAFT_1108589 [Suillus bovinus]|uniref:uncharacterized protein n=1 Tax=Suillus bovinus TaxID=48563 RepID=UPI001B85D13D|nr:uncharacterized protein EDB93DRAFT_1108589 [Suillus bovinus]KAG2129714.1 hypothetical protein EDB93DRAFT_1108589 [Suillus bovinus]